MALWDREITMQRDILYKTLTKAYSINELQKLVQILSQYSGIIQEQDPIKNVVFHQLTQRSCNTLYDYLKKPYENIPLDINNEWNLIQALARWRLYVGR